MIVQEAILYMIHASFEWLKCYGLPGLWSNYELYVTVVAVRRQFCGDSAVVHTLNTQLLSFYAVVSNMQYNV